MYDASTPAGPVALLSFDDRTSGVSVTAIGTAHGYRLEGAGTRLSLLIDMQSDGGLTQASMLAVHDGG